jgi:hypothetical protein
MHYKIYTKLDVNSGYPVLWQLICESYKEHACIHYRKISQQVRSTYFVNEGASVISITMFMYTLLPNQCIVRLRGIRRETSSTTLLHGRFTERPCGVRSSFSLCMEPANIVQI